MARSTFVYVTYIRITPEKLWSALTDVEFMKQYWFGMHCESQWTAGSSWKMVSGDGQILDAGEIVEAEPPRRLVNRWQHQNKPELKAEGESQCTMELEPSGTAVKLPSPTPSSANPRNSSRRCPPAGRRSSPTSSPCWRPAPPLCRTRTRRAIPTAAAESGSRKGLHSAWEKTSISGFSMVMSLMRASSYEVLDLFGLEIKSDNAEEMRRKIL